MAKEIIEIIDDNILKPVTPLKKTTQGFIFTSLLLNLQKDTELAVQYYDYEKAKWITLGTSLTEKGKFEYSYANKLEVFTEMPLFRLADNKSLNGITPVIYQYGTHFSVKLVRTVMTTTVNFGEVIIVDKLLYDYMPKDAIDNTILVGFPAYLTKVLKSTEKPDNPPPPLPPPPLEPEEEEPVYINSNPNAVVMPNLFGLTETACTQILLSFGLKLDPIYHYTKDEQYANGQSLKQSVSAGDYVNRGEIITVLFAKKSINN